MPEQAEKQGDGFVLKADPTIRLDSRAHKMSKSRGNVVNPDDVVKEYGADALRLYEMFMGPLEATKPWSMEGVNGVRGFLDRVWRMIVDERAEDARAQRRPCSRRADGRAEPRAAQDDPGRDAGHRAMAFNTAIAKMMEFTNFFTQVRDPAASRRWKQLVLLLSPFAPHMAEELWQLLGHDKIAGLRAVARVRSRGLHEDNIEVPVQINGKLRARITVPRSATEDEMEQPPGPTSGSPSCWRARRS